MVMRLLQYLHVVLCQKKNAFHFYINSLAVDNSSLLLFSTLSIYQEGRSSILTRYDFVSFRLYTFHAILRVYVVIL